MSVRSKIEKRNPKNKSHTAIHHTSGAGCLRHAGKSAYVISTAREHAIVKSPPAVPTSIGAKRAYDGQLIWSAVLSLPHVFVQKSVMFVQFPSVSQYVRVTGSRTTMHEGKIRPVVLM
jgi:hypothetical protein